MRDFLDLTFVGTQAWLVPGRHDSTIDVWPDTRGFPSWALFESPHRMRDGSPGMLYDCRNPEVMETFHEWLARYGGGLLGMSLHRFVLENRQRMALRDYITRDCWRAAERFGTPFHLKWNLSRHFAVPDPGAGVASDFSWSFLGTALEPIFDSPCYAHQGHRPVVEIWGAGWRNGRNGWISKAQTIKLIDFFQNRGFYVVGGVPYHWRTGRQEARAGWLDVYRQFDMLTPWSVAKYRPGGLAGSFDMMLRDLDWCDIEGIDYRRVVWPGVSASRALGHPPNSIPRDGGQWMVEQAKVALDLNVPILIANLDELDEGTAILPAAETAADAPEGWWLTMDADGYPVRGDQYLWLAGWIARQRRRTQK